MKKTIMPSAIFFKKIIPLLILVLLNTISLHSQSAWQWQNPLPSGNNAAKIYFTDDNTGYIAGASGEILKSTNGGANWISLYTGTYSHFLGIHFMNSLSGWVVGEEGIVLNTTNGGVSWISHPTGWDNSSVFFVSPLTGWIAGGSIGCSFICKIDGSTLGVERFVSSG